MHTTIEPRITFTFKNPTQSSNNRKKYLLSDQILTTQKTQLGF